MPRRGSAQGHQFNIGAPLSLVWVTNIDTGERVSDEPMVLLQEDEQPLIFEGQYGRRLVFALDSVVPHSLERKHYRVVKLDESDPSWPLPTLPTEGPALYQYGKDPEKGRLCDIGAMPTGHTRVDVWYNPKLVEQSPQEKVPIVAMLSREQYHATLPGQPWSMADLMQWGIGIREPAKCLIINGQHQLGFVVKGMTYPMALAIFHSNGVQAEVGDPATQYATDDDIDAAWIETHSKYCTDLLADNIMRNYNSWQQDMNEDPRLGQPRRDQLNWSPCVPSSIQMYLDERTPDGESYAHPAPDGNNRFPAYTMEALAFLIVQQIKTPEDGKMLRKYMPSPMKELVINEMDCHAGARLHRDRQKKIDRVRGELNALRISRSSFSETPADRANAETELLGTARDRALFGCAVTRKRLEEEIAMREEQLQHLRAAQNAEDPDPKYRLKCVPLVQHLRAEQERQLIACLYVCAIYHGMNKNLLRVARTIRWVYALHGKVSRCIGPYSMESDDKDSEKKAQKEYFRNFKARAGLPTASAPLRDFKGTRASKPPKGVEVYRAEKRVRRQYNNMTGGAHTIQPMQVEEQGSVAMSEEEAEDDIM